MTVIAFTLGGDRSYEATFIYYKATRLRFTLKRCCFAHQAAREFIDPIRLLFIKKYNKNLINIFLETEGR